MSVRPSIKIYQTYIQESDLLEFDPAFIPNDWRHNPTPALRENAIFFDFYEKQRHLEADYVGVLSKKFLAKTKIPGEQFITFIRENPGYDVYFINPFPQLVYQSYNVWYNGEISHPGIMNTAQELFDRAGISIKVDDFRNNHDTLLYCNYWVGNSKFWDTYIPFLKKLLQCIQDDFSEEERSIFFYMTSHDDATAPMFPFVFERIFSTFIASRLNVSYLAYRHSHDEIINACTSNYERSNYLAHGKQVDELELIGSSVKSLLNDIYNQFIGNHPWSWLYAKEAFSPSKVEIPHFLKLITYMWPNLVSDLHCDINTDRGALKLITWWGSDGLTVFPTIKWPFDGQYPASLFEKTEKIHPEITHHITEGMMLVWEMRFDLQKLYPLQNAVSCLLFEKWWNKYAFNYFTKPANHNDKNNKNALSELSFVHHRLGYYDNTGVTVAGFPKAEFGIGEDVRMVSSALTYVNVKHLLYNVPIPLEMSTRITEYNHLIAEVPRFQINLFCVPCFETFQLLLRVGPGYFNKRYNIGLWQWELPHWPKNCHSFFNLLQEVWAISSYVAEMFKSATTLPVYCMSNIVELPEFPILSRSVFNLPENKFLFLGMFDGYSRLSRKNPLGIVQAFCRAFPKNNTDVGLVIKAMHVDVRESDWRKILEMADADKRIIIINTQLTRLEICALINCCDAYVSLHRAEGFGRILAEAMLLKKPVIATSFSGNMDFTLPETAFLVNGKMVNLQANDYYGWEGQYWCDPDLEEASFQLQECFHNAVLREARAVAGCERIKNYHSTKVIGERYKKRLLEIGLNLNTI